MRITNNAGLPQALVNAVKNDGYDPGDCDISVTQLISPPQLRRLRLAHEDHITEDAADRIWALFGSVVHGILERAGGTGIAEERLFAECKGYTISGQIDRMTFEGDGGRLMDYKTTSAWTYVLNNLHLRHEWINQLNVYAWLARQNYIKVEFLEILALYRDWSKSKARSASDYPDMQVKVLSVPLWDEDYTEGYIKGCLTAHLEIDPPRECTPAERWAKEEKWAVMKKGRKSALRVRPSKALAVGWAMEKGHCAIADDNIAWATGYYLVERPRDYTRCSGYCPVAEFCPQWAADRPDPEP